MENCLSGLSIFRSQFAREVAEESEKELQNPGLRRGFSESTLLDTFNSTEDFDMDQNFYTGSDTDWLSPQKFRNILEKKEWQWKNSVSILY